MSLWSRGTVAVGVVGLLAVALVGGSVLVTRTALAGQGEGGRSQYAQVFVEKLATILNISGA